VCITSSIHISIETGHTLLATENKRNPMIYMHVFMFDDNDKNDDDDDDDYDVNDQVKIRIMAGRELKPSRGIPNVNPVPPT